ncbi:hypothetical protein CCR75_008450 [Bremia lactucae]|uniref:Sugar transporter SWEET1 n=1 Tax=Bremia lactucae TaxID=4779 RepID=A0A976FJ23_BRELC|nr:hypothetical protein CCR75_008450 [Bremia lactucae]
MTESPCVLVIRVCASMAAIILFVSLSPSIRVVHQQKSTTTMPSALPMLSMLANCVSWGLYGLLIQDYFPLVATNAVGLVLSLCYLVVYYFHEAKKQKLLLECLATALLLVALVLVPIVASHVDMKETVVENIIGFSAVACSAVMFGSPLVLVKKVIKERNTKLLPFSMIIAGAVNCILWLGYGLLLANAFIIVPNAANLLLGVIQLALYCIVPRVSTYNTIEVTTTVAGESVYDTVDLKEKKMEKNNNDAETATKTEQASMIVINKEAMGKNQLKSSDSNRQESAKMNTAARVEANRVV